MDYSHHIFLSLNPFDKVPDEILLHRMDMLHLNVHEIFFHV